ncbi:MAG: hypothetical protein HY866_23495 [Chloroflexi bacterium]|nr:hypothetical protein [Chloroflexota bacterium]
MKPITTKQRAGLQQVITTIHRRWGAEALRPLGEQRGAGDAAGITTGLPVLDDLLGPNGLPRGSLTQFTGSPTSGVTTLALKLAAAIQQHDEPVIYLDPCCTLDPGYAARCGVDPERLLLVRPPTLAAGMNIASDLITLGGSGLLVLDGMACPPGDTLQNSGFQVALRRLAARLPGSAWALLCLTPPARVRLAAACAVPAAVRLRVEKLGWIRNGHDIQGYDVCITVIKDRHGAPGRQGVMAITFDELVQGDST